MSRIAVMVREASPGDATELVELWGAAGSGAAPTHLNEAVRSLAQVAADSDQRLLVAVAGGHVVGAMHLRRAPLSPLHADDVVHTSFLLVSPTHRRHGVACALIEAAVHWAEEKDVTHVTAITSSNSRDTNRFLARLGLATVATVRVATTGTLRKKLGAVSHRAPATRTNVGSVLAARRTMRRRETVVD